MGEGARNGMEFWDSYQQSILFLGFILFSLLYVYRPDYSLAKFLRLVLLLVVVWLFIQFLIGGGALNLLNAIWSFLFRDFALRI